MVKMRNFLLNYLAALSHYQIIIYLLKSKSYQNPKNLIKSHFKKGFSYPDDKLSCLVNAIFFKLELFFSVEKIFIAFLSSRTYYYYRRPTFLIGDRHAPSETRQ